ncbi:MAG TPA: hypothetical protein PL033_01150 [Candidatus Brocadiia bacterium]|nr:hypothetical protein [Candidatus Brocadiia bacterium]
MTIRVRCQSCRQEIGFEEKLLGRQGRCPICKSPVVIKPSVDQPAEAPQAPEEQPEAETSVSKKTDHMALEVFVAGLVVVLIVLAAIWRFAVYRSEKVALGRSVEAMLDEAGSLRENELQPQAAAKYRKALAQAEGLRNADKERLGRKLDAGRKFLAEMGPEEGAAEQKAPPVHSARMRLGVFLLSSAGAVLLFIALWAGSEMLYVALSIEESLRRPDREAPRVNAILMLCVALRTIAIVQLVAVIVVAARWG